MTRTTVVRVSGDLDADATSRLDRVLRDLIIGHGIADLVVDLSQVSTVCPQAVTALEWADDQVNQSGGLMELRLPATPQPSLRDIATRVSSFTPLEPEAH